MIMKHYKIEKDVFLWFVRNDIMEKVGLNFMTLESEIYETLQH